MKNNMKQIAIAFAFVGLTMPALAQTPWKTGLNEIIDPETPSLGTLNSKPLEFYTGGVRQMTITPDGELQLHSMPIPPEDEYQFLTIDHNGYLKAAKPWYPPVTCIPNAAPWMLGGNTATGSNNRIGTCNAVDFVLKANNLEQIFIKPNVDSWGSGLIGFGLGNTNPLSQVDITDGIADPNWWRTVPDHTRIYGDYYGTIEATGAMNLLFNDEFNIGIGPKGASSPILTAANWGAIGIGTTSPSNLLHVSGGTLQVDGNIGVNVWNPSATIDARHGSAADIRAYTTSANTARVTVMNSLLSYNLSVDASAIGHIGAGTNNILNFQMGGWPQFPQVWIGQRPTSGAHTNYNFAAPKIVAKEIYVFTSGWADYVFADDYKLPQLSDVEAYYKEHKHLPEIPSACQVEEEGISVGEMNKLLLKKVEELTIYVVEQQKEINHLKEKLK